MKKPYSSNFQRAAIAYMTCALAQHYMLKHQEQSKAPLLVEQLRKFNEINNFGFHKFLSIPFLLLSACKVKSDERLMMMHVFEIYIMPPDKNRPGFIPKLFKEEFESRRDIHIEQVGTVFAGKPRFEFDERFLEIISENSIAYGIVELFGIRDTNPVFEKTEFRLICETIRHAIEYVETKLPDFCHFDAKLLAGWNKNNFAYELYGRLAHFQETDESVKKFFPHMLHIFASDLTQPSFVEAL